MKPHRRSYVVDSATATVSTGLPLRSAYVASKRALIWWTQNLARELGLGRHIIRCSAIRPRPMREVTNQMHQCRDLLRSWHAWNLVIATHEERTAWDLRREFLVQIVHFCLIKPAALRDTLTFVGTNAFHQVRLSSESTYRDSLEGDPSPEDPTPRPLTRRKKEARLRKLCLPLVDTKEFVDALWKTDDADHRRQTSDSRNLHSHAIGPRYALGITRAVPRRVMPATKPEPLDDGHSFRIVESNDRYVPSYSFGVLEPLDSEVARLAAPEQYRLVRACFQHLTRTLEQYASTMPGSQS